ncbi:MAG: hypothetical protein ACK5UQ_03040 [Planctomycetota bacterium]
MSRSRAAIAALLLVAAAAPATAQSVVLQRGSAAGALRVGAPFELEVLARWAAGEAPLELDGKQLAPLHVDAIAREAVAGAITWRATVRSYVAGDVVVAPVVLQFQHAGGAKPVASAPLTLAIASSLPQPAGELEWPGDVRERPRGFGPWPWLGLTAVALGTMAWWRRRGALPPAVVMAPAAPEDLAARLRELPLPTDRAALVPFCQQVKALLRQHVQTQHRVAADVATSEELVRLPRIGAALQPCLQVVDRVLFAAAEPAPAVLQELRDAAVRCVADDRAGERAAGRGSA